MKHWLGKKADIVKVAQVKESLVELLSLPKLEELDRTLRSFLDREALEHSGNSPCIRNGQELRYYL